MSSHLNSLINMLNEDLNQEIEDHGEPSEHTMDLIYHLILDLQEKVVVHSDT